MKYNVGYVTMTGDTPHQGHFNLLSLCKTYCEKLIVGLTTDEVAQSQKRPTIMEYPHREAIFRNCKWVDAVVPHNGLAKAEDWRRLQFDVCFTCAEEYLDSEEFNLLRAACPSVAIVGIPRSPDVSSTKILVRIQNMLLSQLKIAALGTAGHVLKWGNTLIKPLHLAREDTDHTGDGFGFFHVRRNEANLEDSKLHLPRQFKHLGEEGLFPNISGINPQREIAINEFFRDKPWSVFSKFTVAFQQEPILPPLTTTQDVFKDETLQHFAQRVAHARNMRFARIVFIHMKYGGITLAEWAQTLDPKADYELFHSVYDQVDTIMDEIRYDGVLHGDIHANNVLVDPHTKKVSLIDWGWCSSLHFEMTEQEREWLQVQLSQKWDATHFHGSCQNNVHIQPFISRR